MANLQQRKDEEVDRISHLPNGILSHILGFLSLKEAARTSVLSKDWIKRWLTVDDLFFDVREFYEEEVLWFFTSGLAVNMERHSEWVSRVLRAHHEAMMEMDGGDMASVVKKLRFRVPLSETFQENLDEWISYAFARKVETLELKLASNYKKCSFPTRLIVRNLDCLKSLSLVGIDVTGEDLKVFLQKFRFLETLKLCLSDKLDSVEVCGPLALRHLEFTDSPNIKNAVVVDTSLVSLTFSWMNSITLRNNPNLIELQVGGWIREAVTGRMLTQFSDSFPRLESLTLEADYVDPDEVIAEVPRLSKLKELTLIGNPTWTGTLVRMTTLLCLSPKLEKLTFEFGDEHGYDFVNMDYMNAIRSGNRPVIHLPHLRTVEVREYYGDVAEDGLLKYFFKYVRAPIATVTFDPNNLRRVMAVPARRYVKEIDAEIRAILLQSVIPSYVKFIVI